jgi:hypothetical protein
MYDCAVWRPVVCNTMHRTMNLKFCNTLCESLVTRCHQNSMYLQFNSKSNPIIGADTTYGSVPNM